MQPKREIEVRFGLMGSARPQEAGPLWDAVAQSKPIRQVARYFDTPDQRLRAHGLSLRLRTAGRRPIMTLKQAGVSPINRGEWEWELAANQLVMAPLLTTPFAELFSKIDPAALLPGFSTTVRRRTGTVTAHRARLQITFDDGELRAGDHTIAIRDFEIEQMSGPASGLFRYLRNLPPDQPLHLELLSKSDRGNLLADGHWGQPVKGAPVRLQGHETAGEAFTAIAYACLRQFAFNRPAFAAGHAIGAVHQSRVALRRLRAAISLFKPIVEDRVLEELRSEISWLGGLLGQARDLDVLQTETILPAVEKRPAVVGIAELAKAIETERQAAHALLAVGLASSRASNLLLGLCLWIEDGPWRRAKKSVALRDAEARHFARKELARRFRKFSRRARKLESLSDTKLHEERIRAKKLRYGSEFFSSLMQDGGGGKAGQRMIKAMEEIQSALGEIQDAHTRSQYLTERAQHWAGVSADKSQSKRNAADILAGDRPPRAALIGRAANAATTACLLKPFWEDF